MQDFNPNDEYAINGADMNRIKGAMERLFSETRFKNGDEMRDWAQTIEYALNHAILLLSPSK